MTKVQGDIIQIKELKKLSLRSIVIASKIYCYLSMRKGNTMKACEILDSNYPFTIDLYSSNPFQRFC